MPWPPGTEALWRCEITQHSGILHSDFRVVALKPGAKRGIELGRTSSHVRSGWGAEASDAELSETVGQLARRLRDAGWEPVRPGRDWYSVRFVWPRPGPPPLELPDPEPTEVAADDR